MITRLTTRSRVLLAVLAGGAATAAWAQAGRTVTYQGRTVCRAVRVIDGRPWVPLADAARLVGGTAAPVAGGYEIRADDAGAAPAGGADEIRGLRGAQGRMLFTGKWRLEVTRVETVDTYTSNHRPADTVTASGPGDALVVVHAVIKNGVPQTRQLLLRLPNAVNTALTDDQGQSHPPRYFDFPGDSGYGPTLLPGASVDIALLFSIPKGTHLKDLVLSLAALEDNNPADVRIALTPAAPASP